MHDVDDIWLRLFSFWVGATVPQKRRVVDRLKREVKASRGRATTERIRGLAERLRRVRG